MKLNVVLIAAALVATVSVGSALAQGSFSSNRPKTTWTSGAPRTQPYYGVPATPATPAYGGSTTARIYGPPATPKAERFKPYEPYKPASVFGPDGKKKR